MIKDKHANYKGPHMYQSNVLSFNSYFVENLSPKCLLPLSQFGKMKVLWS